jgi:hypothetical protein
VHGIELDGMVTREKQNTIETVIYTSKINQLRTSDDVETDVVGRLNNSQAEELYERLEEKCKSVKPDKTKYIKYFNEHGKTSQLIEAVNDDKQLNKGKGAPKNVIDFLKKTVMPEKHTTKSSNNGQITLFANSPIGKEFCSDDAVFYHIESFLPNDKNIRKRFKEDLDWFQSNHNEIYQDKKNGQQKGSYADKSKDNNSTIERYKTFLENRKNPTNPKMEWLRPIYMQINTEQIISKIKQLYL